MAGDKNEQKCTYESYVAAVQDAMGPGTVNSGKDNRVVYSTNPKGEIARVSLPTPANPITAIDTITPGEETATASLDKNNSLYNMSVSNKGEAAGHNLLKVSQAIKARCP
jgi:hypothetical protein